MQVANVGLYLSDLQFTKDGITDMLPNNEEFINFWKRRKAAGVIQDLLRYQTIPYQFLSDEKSQTWLDLELEKSKKIECLFEKSKEVEPREKER